MVSPREMVVEDILQRIAEEHGTETMSLDWAVLDTILENEEKDNDQE